MAGQMVTLMAAAALLWLWSTAWYPLEKFPHTEHRRSFGLRDSGTSNTLLEKLRPCLFTEIHRCPHLAILSLAPILEGARWAFVERPWVGAGGLVCMALVAAMAFKARAYLSGPNARDWEYELLACSDPSLVPDASFKDILGKWQTKARIALTGFLWVADVFSDVYVAVTYCRNGLFVFGGLLVAITLGSGVVGFLQARNSWKLAEFEDEVNFSQRRNERGEPRPGPWELLLYILQVQPMKVAYKSFMQGEETRELVREKVLANLAESVPSAVLQAYALAVEGAPRKGNLTILLISLAISLCSMSDAANKGYRYLCADDKTEKCVAPAPVLLAWRCADVGARICGWALLGMALRPVDASKHGIQQPMLPVWMLLEAAACVLIYKAMFHKAWEDLYQPQEMMEMLLTFVTVPWPCFKQALLRRQLRLQRVVLLGRSIATIGTVTAVAVKYGSVVPNGVCPLASRPALEAMAIAALAFDFTMVLGAVIWEALLCRGKCLFPVAQGLQSGPLHVAVRLGNLGSVKSFLADAMAEAEAAEPEGQSADSGNGDRSGPPSHVQAAHEAACSGEVAVFCYLLSQKLAVDEMDGDGLLPIHHAAKSGMVEVLQVFADDTELTLNAVDKNGCTAAHHAAAAGHMEVLRFLKEQQEDLNALDNEGSRPVHYAAQGGHVEALLALQGGEAKELLGAQNKRKQTPAHWAAKAGRISVLKVLQDVGVQLATADETNQTPALLAATYGHVEALQLLLKASTDSTGRTVAFVAAKTGLLDALKVLHEARAELDARNEDGHTPAYQAARFGHTDALKFLLHAGIDPCAKTNAGGTLATAAARAGNLEVLKLVMKAKVDLEAAWRGWTAASLFAHWNCKEALRLLCEARANLTSAILHEAETIDLIDPKDKDRRAASSADAGYETVLRFLLEARADLTKPIETAKNDRSSIHFAAQAGHVKAMRVLVEAKVDLEAADRDGLTAASISAHKGHEAVLRLLFEARANLTTATETSKDHRAPIHFAAEHGHVKALRVLLEASADPNLSDIHDETPIKLAQQGRHHQALYLLGGTWHSNFRTLGPVASGFETVYQNTLGRFAHSEDYFWGLRPWWTSPDASPSASGQAEVQSNAGEEDLAHRRRSFKAVASAEF